jgi:RND family efflux transporter MFP subunit
VPLQGVIEQPLIRVGDYVAEGKPVAVVNSVYGQTAQQTLQKLEQDQTAVIQAESTLSQSENTLGQTEATLSAARTAYSQAVDNNHQAESELTNAKNDLKRKKRLLDAGVAAKSDVEDSTERYDKAVSAARDGDEVVRYAKQGVTISQKNLRPAQDSVHLATDGVRVARVSLERDRAIFGQAGLTGAQLPQNLTPVHLGSTMNGAQAGATTEFYIRSPISGTVTSVTMSAGLSASPGTVVATIINTRQVYVDANAFDSDLSAIHTGDAVEVTSSSAPATTFKGRVNSIARQVDPASRTVAVRSLIQNSAGLLRPAMYVDVLVASHVGGRAILVPDTAVILHGDDHYVYIQKAPGQFEKRPVKLGIQSAGRTEIKSGLRVGDTVVTEGNLLLDAQE